MLNDRTAEKIRKEKVPELNIVATSKDIRLPCTIFDNKVSELCRLLREAISNIEFRFNSCTENYKIIIPRKLSNVAKETLVAILTQTPLTIKVGYSFGNL